MHEQERSIPVGVQVMLGIVAIIVIGGCLAALGDVSLPQFSCVAEGDPCYRGP